MDPAPATPRPSHTFNRSWIPQSSHKLSRPRGAACTGVNSGLNSDTGDLLFPLSWPLAGPVHVGTRVISEMRPMGAQLRGQQGPWHVPAQILHPQRGVGKQTPFWAGFSLYWQCESTGEMSSHSLLCPASVPTAFHTIPFPPFPSWQERGEGWGLCTKGGDLPASLAVWRHPWDPGRRWMAWGRCQQKARWKRLCWLS